MGLDINVLKSIEFIDVNYDNEDEDIIIDKNGKIYTDENYYKLYLNPYFPLQSQGLKSIIKINDHNFDYSFRAGSYGNYNAWRNNLAKILGYEDYSGDGDYDLTVFELTEGPFWELIKFSDCEGVINSQVSKKLLNDFIEYDSVAKKEGGHFYELYRNFHKAFEIASKNGVVIFS